MEMDIIWYQFQGKPFTILNPRSFVGIFLDYGG